MTTKAKKTVEASTFTELGDALESAAERFEEGAANVRQTTNEAAGTVSRALKIGVYNAAFGISYGTVYATIFLTELLPKENVIRRGLEDGADAAVEARAQKSAAKKEGVSSISIRRTRSSSKQNGR